MKMMARRGARVMKWSWGEVREKESAKIDSEKEEEEIA